jgi:hypothetical protein
VADALAALHSQRPPYLHGDVTSDNVFLEDHAHLSAAAVKLGDLKPHRWGPGGGGPRRREGPAAGE